MELAGTLLTGTTTRFTVISPTVIRMEYSQTGTFTDQPTFLVRDRDWGEAAFTHSVDNGILQIDTGQMLLRYKLDEPFSQESLSVSWKMNGKEQTWRFGQKDSQNLGGTNWGLDAVGHQDWFPNITDPNGCDFKPGLLSHGGYCVIDDSNGALWDADSGWITARPEDPSRKDLYFFVYGTDYKGFIANYIRLTGPVPMLPKWVFGSWYSRYHPYHDHELKEIVETYREKEIPLDVIVVDLDWHLWGWVGYDWNTECFPDPEGFLRWCRDNGLRVSLNDHTPEIHGKYVFPAEDNHYQPIVERLGLPSGKPIQLNFEIREHWQAFRDIVLYPLMDQGMDLWWQDYKGTKSEPKPLVNPRTWLAKLSMEAAEERKGERPVAFMRYGDLGMHRYPIGFSGDAFSQWNVLDFEVPFTSRSANVVYPYWSHDIGGFHGMWLDPEMFVRWVQFGCFSPVLRLHSSKDEHGNGGHRLPWEYGEEAERIIKSFYQLRYRLMHYIYTYSRITHETGIPLCRPMYLENPASPEAYKPELEGQYFFGESILVAPVTSPGENGTARKRVYLPEGAWYDFFTDEMYIGPAEIEAEVPLDKMPIFVKAGAVIPMQPDMQHVNEKPADPLIIHVYAGADGNFKLYEDDGISLGYRNGEYAWTPISYNDATGELTIGPTEGQYKGQLEARRYEIVVHRSEGTGTRISVPAKSIRQPFTAFVL